jgi:hypothetical protein
MKGKGYSTLGTVEDRSWRLLVAVEGLVNEMRGKRCWAEWKGMNEATRM